jgi:hypothetical protein
VTRVRAIQGGTKAMVDYTESDEGQHDLNVARERAHEDDGIRALFVILITFIAGARASHDMKNDALDAVQKLQARLLT